MSIENAERLIRFVQADKKLREKVATAGAENFEEVTAIAGASCTAYDVVCAMIRSLNKAK